MFITANGPGQAMIKIAVPGTPPLSFCVFTIRPGAAPFLGDCDNDGVVNSADLALLLGAWGTRSADADLNGDGSVNAGDLAILLGARMH